MLQSQLFTKTRKESPSDEVSKNASLLIKAGFIYKEVAGVYSYLPLGLRVLNKINNIIRKEMDDLGGQEVLLSAMQNPEEWKKSDRWDLPVWFKTKLSNGSDTGLGWTHEEHLANIMTNHIHSYKDLPRFVYQIQTKFRNEERAKSGILRGREFLMKDFYSFHTSSEDLDSFYEKAKKAYINIFNKVGIGEITYTTLASGGAFSKFSHEFQTICQSGEDIIYVSKEKNLAVNREVYEDEVLKEAGLSKNDLVEEKSVEVGNIFKLGTRFSEPLGLNYKGEDGKQKPVVMGSYGIGPGRLMGTVVETLSDEKGIIWPESITPFKVHLLRLGDSQKATLQGEEIYNKLKSILEVLYDDRENVGAGEKLKDADLIGIPYRIIVSEKTLDAGGVGVKRRDEEAEKIMTTEELFNLMKS